MTTETAKLSEDDYIPYGPEWEKEFMRWRKKDLIDFIRNLCQKGKEATPKPQGEGEEDIDPIAFGIRCSEWVSRAIRYKRTLTDLVIQIESCPSNYLSQIDIKPAKLAIESNNIIQVRLYDSIVKAESELQSLKLSHGKLVVMLNEIVDNYDSHSVDMWIDLITRAKQLLSSITQEDKTEGNEKQTFR